MFRNTDRLSRQALAAYTGTTYGGAMTTIAPGNRVLALNAFGERVERIAITSVTAGRDFPVVWACREEEWSDAEREGRAPEGVPWPADDVVPA